MKAPSKGEKMNTSDFISSADFRVFLDETLLACACQAVDYFLENNKAINNSQLHSIFPTLQSGGFKGLKELIENQENKNSSKVNKAFWKFVSGLVENTPDSRDFSLHRQISKELTKRHILEDTTQAANKKQAGFMKKNNKKRIEEVMNQAAAVYFEHFTCHYFYKNNQNNNRKKEHMNGRT
jgi:hypothetical protein